MGADYSRVRFDPLRDFSGFSLQQGRLLLDSDLNEQVAITDRRLRAHVVDLALPGTVVVSRQTPGAFQIGLSGADLTIGAGRMYVDGLLAENHGADPGFDPVLAEPNGTGVLTYSKQPHWPVPDTLPDANGPHLVYLDVWDREVTHLQAPDLVEPAIGVDTTTRTQTVWQVRVLADVDAKAGCDSDIAAWTALTAPSSARLTTGTIEIDAAEDPCELPPGKGYRGPENQLYRIELHDGGAKPTFKWSRDNASVASAVVEWISATELRLASLGRDEVLRFRSGDWVEIIDDRRELFRQPGEMRRIVVDPTKNSVISFQPALPPDITATGDHLRVRRWDQHGTVKLADGSVLANLDDPASPGVIPVPPGTSAVVLEHGVTVAFTFAAKGGPRAGDYWVAAARVADASIEQLTAAPPRGIHHHYARLALVTKPGTVTDCRPGWPTGRGGGCECEICVTPGGRLSPQDAVTLLDKLGGGTLSLCPGTYQLQEPLSLRGVRGITVRGAGESSVLRGSGTLVAVGRSIDVTLEHFMVASAGDEPAVLLETGNMTVDVSRLRVFRLGRTEARPVAVGLSGVQILVSIHECQLTAAIGVGVVRPPGQEAPTNLLTYELRIESNLLQCDFRGVDLTGICKHGAQTSITGNTVVLSTDAGIAVTGLVAQDTGDNEVAIDGTLEVRGNLVQVAGTGIITGGRATIADNTLVAPAGSASGHAIVLLDEPPDTRDGTALVLANQITGYGGAGVAVAASMRSLLVKQNVIRRTGSGVAIEANASAGNVSIDNNQILDLRTPAEGVDDKTVLLKAGTSFAGVAIGVAGVRSVTVAGNTIDGITAAGRSFLAAIAIVSCDQVRVSGNTIAGIGAAQPERGCYGIAVGGWLDTASLADNMVRNGATVDPVLRPHWTALVMQADVEFGLGKAVKLAGGAALFLGDRVYLQGAAHGHAELLGNTLYGGAEEIAVVVTTPGDVVMHANRCVQPRDADHPAAEVTAGTAVIQGNRLRDGRPSMRLTVDVDAATVIGNVTTGGITIGGRPVENTGKPWSRMNASGV